MAARPAGVALTPAINANSLLCAAAQMPTIMTTSGSRTIFRMRIHSLLTSLIQVLPLRPGASTVHDPARSAGLSFRIQAIIVIIPNFLLSAIGENHVEALPRLCRWTVHAVGSSGHVPCANSRTGGSQTAPHPD